MKRKTLFPLFSIFTLLLTGCGNNFKDEFNKNHKISLGEQVDTINIMEDGEILASLSKDMTKEEFVPIVSQFLFRPRNFKSECYLKLEMGNDSDKLSFESLLEHYNLDWYIEGTQIACSYDNSNTKFKDSTFNEKSYSLQEHENYQRSKFSQITIYSKNNHIIAGGKYSTDSGRLPIIQNGKELPNFPQTSDNYPPNNIFGNYVDNFIFPFHILSFNQTYGESTNQFKVIDLTNYSLSLYENYIVVSYESQIPIIGLQPILPRDINAVLSSIDGTTKIKGSVYFDTTYGILIRQTLEGTGFCNGRLPTVSLDYYNYLITDEEFSSILDKITNEANSIF